MFGANPEEDLAIATYIHDAIIDASGGSKGYHNLGLIQSALARPLHSAFGDDAYKTMFAKAAALLSAIASNHGFVDGNKRTAMALALYYLYRNNYNLRITNTEYEEFMLHVVRDKPDVPEITNWLVQHRDKRIL